MIFLSLLPLLASLAHADLRTNDLISSSVVSHDVSGRRAEICVIPQHLPVGSYSKKDAEKEAELCNYDVGVTAAACAKISSTNPGVNFFLPPAGMSAADLMAKNCDDKTASKVAKYKLSTACSYSPSIVSYYHVSRALGNIANVPQVVLRTLDLQRHIAIGTKGLAVMEQKNLSGEVVYNKWVELLEKLKLGRSGRASGLLFAENFDQSYGALLAHPHKTEFYREFFNGGQDEDRIEQFKSRNRIYSALQKAKLSMGRDFTLENVQAMRQLKDAADFILLDTIMGQQDRIGNIDFKEKFYYQMKKDDGSISIATKGDLTVVPQELQAKALKVKEAVLEDNDCGVAKEQLIKKHAVLDPISHIDPKTYHSLLAFNKWVKENNGAARDFFLKGMAFTEQDFRSVTNNLSEATDMLRARCERGRLSLDLDLDLYFSDRPLPTAYDCAN